MTYLDDASIRRTVYGAYSVRATEGEHDNRPIIARILELRREKARLLGFANFADLVLEDRMAHTGARALASWKISRPRPSARFREENRELFEFRRSIEGPDAPELAPWDVGYYAEKQRAALYDFDEEALRPYFPLESVVEGMWNLVNRLYGIRVTEEAERSRLGRAREVLQHPRRRRRASSAASTPTGIRAKTSAAAPGWTPSSPAVPSADGFKPHLGLICGNLTPPVGDKPALLTHREVETIFHEFGHLLHHLLSRVEVRSLAGTSVAWDFVELPSQIMENWCWEREALDLFARHWQTGEPIPEDLFQKMKRARTFRAANAQMRQLGFGFVDLLLHIRYIAGTRRRSGRIRARHAAGIQPRAAAAQPRHDRGVHASVREPGGLRRRLLFLQMGGGAGCRRLHALPRQRHLQPRGRDRFPQPHSLERRQRRSGGTVQEFHGARTGPERAVAALRIGVAASKK